MLLCEDGLPPVNTPAYACARVVKIIFKNIFFYKINLLNFRITNCKSQITRHVWINLLRARNNPVPGKCAEQPPHGVMIALRTGEDRNLNQL